ncbi:MAG: lysophospholipid acyltransferase family protein [Chloroflexota bacterium]|nr:lysophospholipid acyltransferase family protein [Chloroflexota bacterium]
MTHEKKYTVPYPRRRFIRAIMRIVFRILLRILFRVRVTGRENFPKDRPLLLVGNHVGAIEAVLLAVFTPWQIEMLGAGDLPVESIVEIIEGLYGYISINRGAVDRSALRQSLGVLEQGGRLSIFPEGGTWEPGAMRAQTGVSWLSYRGKAPVLPVAFSGTFGALDKALKFKRPTLTMRVGELIPAAELPDNQGRKPYLQEYANQVMEAVKALLSPDDPSARPDIENERFELEIKLQDQDGTPRSVPSNLEIQHPESLVKFLHRPAILAIFDADLDLPIDALQNLHTIPRASEISEAARLVIEVLESEYQYLLVYRYGPQKAEKMKHGLMELRALAQWADKESLVIKVVPVRRYHFTGTEEEIVQIEQEAYGAWI